MQRNETEKELRMKRQDAKYFIDMNENQFKDFLDQFNVTGIQKIAGSKDQKLINFANIYEQNDVEIFETSSTVKNFVDYLDQDQTFTKEQKYRYKKYIWKQANQLANQVLPKIQYGGNFKANQNDFTIQELDSEYFYCPSNGNCGIKIIKYIQNQLTQKNQLTIEQIQKLQELYEQNEEGMLKDGQSTGFIDQCNKIFNQVGILDQLSKKIKKAYVEYLFTNFGCHYVLIKNQKIIQSQIVQQKDVLCQIQQYLTYQQQNQSITQKDIDNLISLEQAEKLKYKKKNAKRQKRQEKYKNDNQQVIQKEVQKEIGAQQNVYIFDIESYQKQGEDELQIPFQIGYYRQKIRQFQVNQDVKELQLNCYQQQYYRQLKKLKNELEHIKEGQAFENPFDEQIQLKYQQKKKEIKNLQENYQKYIEEHQKIQFDQQLIKQFHIQEITQDVYDNQIQQYNSLRFIDKQKPTSGLILYGNDPKTLISQFIDEIVYDMSITTNQFNTAYLIGHNVKNYDNLILLQYLKSGYYLNKDSSITIRFSNIRQKGNSITFDINYEKKLKNGKMGHYCIKVLDSLDIVKGKLSKLCQDFQLYYNKLDSSVIQKLTSYEQATQNIRDITHYFAYDLLSLYELYMKVRNIFLELNIGQEKEKTKTIDILFVDTIAQVSFKYYKQVYNKNYQQQTYYFDSVSANELFRQCLRGGRTISQLRQSDEILYYLDEASLYPSAMFYIQKMCNGYYILDKHSIIMNDQQQLEQRRQSMNNNYKKIFETLSYLRTYSVGCFDIEIPEQQQLISVYSKQKFDNITAGGYVYGQLQNQYLTSWNLIQLMYYNKAKITKIHYIIDLKTKVQMNIDQYMQSLREYRNQLKKQGNVAGEQMIKVVMNSFYGKTGQKPIKKRTKYSRYSQEYRKKVQQKNTDNIAAEQRLDENSYFHIYQEDNLEKQLNGSNIMIACQILDFSKIIVNEKIEIIDGFGINNIENKIKYSDTDSIVVNKQQYEILKQSVSRITGLLCIPDDNNAQLGQMKLEYICKDWFSPGKKMYEFTNQVGEYIFRLKGASIRDENIAKQVFNQLKNNEQSVVKQIQFIRKINEQQIGITVDDDVQKILKNTYELDNKTIQLENGNVIYIPISIQECLKNIDNINEQIIYE